MRGHLKKLDFQLISFTRIRDILVKGFINNVGEMILGKQYRGFPFILGLIA